MGQALPRILVTGASGQLGGYLLRELRRQGAVDVVAWSGSRPGELFGYPLRPVDLANVDEVATVFRQAQPDVVLHAGALATVAACYKEPERARQVNVGGSVVLAELAAAADDRLVLVSTDLVFDGERGGYREDDPPTPLSAYGRSKAAAEQAVRAGLRNLVVRVSLMFGPTLSGRPAFFDEQLTALRERRPVTLFTDEYRTPLSLATAARALAALVSADVTGILHVGGPERLSRLEMGLRLAAFLGADPGAIRAARQADVPMTEPRPRDVSLDSSAWRRLFPGQPWPGYEEALRELVAA